MKRIYQTLLFSLIVFGCAALSGCDNAKKNETKEADGKINVTVSIFAPYDFVRQIAGDRVNLSMLLPPGAEVHSFEPAPKDIISLQNSDVFIYIGGESDQWAGRILNSVNTDGMKVLSMLDTVELVEEELVEGMEEEDEEEGGDTAYDEHVWTAPANAVLIVRAITELLCGADSANADFYRQNAAAYTEKLVALDSAFNTILAGAKRKTIVFGDRFPFRYFADAYGLTYYAAFPGCSVESEPSAATVAFLINKIRAEKIPVVFHIELSNEKMANTISEATGAKKLLLHACHIISREDFDSGLDYLELMRRNAENLREALW